MSDILELIKDARESQQDLVSFSVRLPQGLYSYIGGMADQLTLSKQEVLLSLIKTGVRIAEEGLGKEEATSGTFGTGNFHILNTNKKHSSNDQETMLTNGEAAAFYGKWKEGIKRIKKGDTVFLYENGVGVIAYGNGSGDTKIRDHNGDVNECYYQELENFKRLKKPVPAREIRKKLERKLPYLKAMFSISDGQKLLDLVNGNS